MKMKDKLVKFGHKRSYYTMKKCVISLGVFAGLAVAASIPLTMDYFEKAPVAPHAEGTENTETNEKAEENNEKIEEKAEEIVPENLLSY